MYKMIMSLCKGSWDINSALCGWPAGKGPSASCKHIGPLCYALANFCSSGRLPDFITCTDVMQEWNKPCPKSTIPLLLMNYNLQKGRYYINGVQHNPYLQCMTLDLHQ